MYVSMDKWLKFIQSFVFTPIKTECGILHLSFLLIWLNPSPFTKTITTPECYVSTQSRRSTNVRHAYSAWMETMNEQKKITEQNSTITSVHKKLLAVWVYRHTISSVCLYRCSYNVGTRWLIRMEAHQRWKTWTEMLTFCCLT